MTVQHINNTNGSSYVLLRKPRLLVTTYLLLLAGVGVRIMSMAQSVPFLQKYFAFGFLGVKFP